MRLRIPRLLARWAAITVSISALLFFAAGTTHVSSLRSYLAVFSSLLLATMLTVDPDLAKERAHPEDTGVDDGLRFAARLLFLLTLTFAALSVGRLRHTFNVPTHARDGGLVAFAFSGALQAWAMVVNPFFSPTLRIQAERGHRVIADGPYRFIRHPGYLAMSISVLASTLAIGSWIALIPAGAFVLVIRRRAQLEGESLRNSLSGYIAYARKVRGSYAG